MGTSVFILGKLLWLLLIFFPQVEQAVAALLKYVSTKEEKPNPFKEHDNILLILALKKIPEKGKKPKKM